MPVLDATQLSKAFGGEPILTDATLTIRRGERVGLVGNNGTGKGTLGKILAGVSEADGCVIRRRRGSTVAYLSQVPDLPEDLSAKDAVLHALVDWRAALERHESLSAKLAETSTDALLDQLQEASEDVEKLGGWDLSHSAEAIMHKLGISDTEQMIGSMSGGEQRRVALAQILVSPPDLAILDEPTNHLDLDAIEWLENHMVTAYPGALLLITHDRTVLNRVVTRTLELESGRLHSYEGGWEAYLFAKAERESIAARTESNRQNFLRTELEWLRRQPKARTGKQKARIGRAEAAIDAKPMAATGEVKLGAAGERLGSTIVELRNATVSIGDRVLIRNFTMGLMAGERIGIVGPNGVGKTSLLRALMGELELSGGELTVGKNTRFGYFDQTRSGLDDNKTIRENVADDSQYVTWNEQQLTVFNYLERFLFTGERIRQPVGSLSGGERARVALAKMLLGKMNVLRLDEPTNDLDVATLGALEQLLLGFKGTALVVTHDRYFLNRIATSVLAFEPGGRVSLYRGNYAAYLANRPARAALEAAAKKALSEVQQPSPSASADPVAKSTVKLGYKDKRELDGLPAQIEGWEAKISAVEAKLADPDLYTKDTALAAELNTELAQLTTELDSKMERWEFLETKREGG